MSIASAYSSTHPDVLAALEDTQARYRDWHSKVKEFAAGYPGHTPTQSKWSSSISINGLRGAVSPGVGWRYERRIDSWVPDKRRREGKALVPVLASLEADRLGILPGMPVDSFTNNGRFFHHSTIAHEGVIYVGWPGSHDQIETSMWSSDRIDLTMWVRCPLSLYHAAVEASSLVAA